MKRRPVWRPPKTKRYLLKQQVRVEKRKAEDVVAEVAETGIVIGPILRSLLLREIPNPNYMPLRETENQRLLGQQRLTLMPKSPQPLPKRESAAGGNDFSSPDG
jgi:hypothetical protein